jgi:hypothetical protein
VRLALPPRALACLLAAVAVSGCTSEKSSEKASPSTFDAEHSSFTPETIETYAAAPLYWLGTRFERWGISTILGPSRQIRTISFIYGTCTPTDGDEPSCLPPIEVQVTPLCRHLETVARDPIWRDREIRGAPVGKSDNAPILFSRRAQVQVYTSIRDQDLGVRALRALRSANRVEPVVAADEPIPPARRAVLAGNEPCR